MTSNSFTVELRRELADAYETSAEPFTEVYPKTGKKWYLIQCVTYRKPRRKNRASARSSGRFIWIIGHPVAVACRSVGNVRFSISRPRRFTFRIFHRTHCPLCTGATVEVKGLTAARAETFHPELTALLCMGYHTNPNVKL
ncbi:hypothetical protein K0M31_010130 [Melipona bicolor]|uniref:Uncharacterized protein n=1 Tax=Melipona bicolor TaxID=60889 RepID=A0AA40FMU2_9HYME|nr:hypothetical protein K0M31_010130 [Melipona bicolor]